MATLNFTLSHKITLFPYSQTSNTNASVASCSTLLRIIKKQLFGTKPKSRVPQVTSGAKCVIRQTVRQLRFDYQNIGKT